MFFVKSAFTRATSTCMCRNFAKYIRREDPGIARQKQLLALDANEEVDDFEDFESDFMEVHKSHKEHVREMELLNEQTKYFIVKQKYFKEKFPNFLTWHDKEQIRYLYKTNPEEWTIDRLSEGFPALPDIIKKIVRSNWIKPTQNKILNHDNSVQKNWKLFKDGQIPKLPKDLAEHLKKFTNRALNLKPFVQPEISKTVIKSKNNMGTEFSDIIKSYQQFKNIPQMGIEEVNNNANDIQQNAKYTAKSGTKGKSVTLNQLQLELTKKAELGKNIDEDEKYIITHSKEKMESTEENKQEALIDLSTNKYQTSDNSLQYFKKTEKDLSHLHYPEKISIPKSIFKRGTIYKLNDCYYDDDGEFLYRVPGMC